MLLVGKEEKGTPVATYHIPRDDKEVAADLRAVEDPVAKQAYSDEGAYGNWVEGREMGKWTG